MAHRTMTGSVCLGLSPVSSERHSRLVGQSGCSEWFNSLGLALELFDEPKVDIEMGARRFRLCVCTVSKSCNICDTPILSGYSIRRPGAPTVNRG